jgi:hypothetical protein
MRKKICSLIISVLCIAFISSTAFLSPTSAAVTVYAHASASGFTAINLPDHQPAITIAVQHYDRGDNGAGDYLEVDTYSPVMKINVPVAILTDSSATAAFLRDFVYKGLPIAKNIQLVDRCDLQVCRIGRIVFAYWATTIVGITVVTPPVTLPPGYLLFSGHGNAEKENIVWNLPNGVTLTHESMVSAAHATFVCQTWNFFGSIGNEDTVMGFNINEVATHA